MTSVRGARGQDECYAAGFLRRSRKEIGALEHAESREAVRFLSLTMRRRLNPWRPGGGNTAREGADRCRRNRLGNKSGVWLALEF